MVLLGFGVGREGTEEIGELEVRAVSNNSAIHVEVLEVCAQEGKSNCATRIWPRSGDDNLSAMGGCGTSIDCEYQEQRPLSSDRWWTSYRPIQRLEYKGQAFWFPAAKSLIGRPSLAEAYASSSERHSVSYPSRGKAYDHLHSDNRERFHTEAGTLTYPWGVCADSAFSAVVSDCILWSLWSQISKGRHAAHRPPVKRPAGWLLQSHGSSVTSRGFNRKYCGARSMVRGTRLREVLGRTAWDRCRPPGGGGGVKTVSCCC